MSEGGGQDVSVASLSDAGLTFYTDTDGSCVYSNKCKGACPPLASGANGSACAHVLKSPPKCSGLTQVIC